MWAAGLSKARKSGTIDSRKSSATWSQESVLGGECGNRGQTACSRSLVPEGTVQEIMNKGRTGAVAGLGGRNNNVHMLLDDAKREGETVQGKGELL